MSIYTRGLERSDYGIVEYVLVLQLLIQVVAGLELTQAIARFYGGADTETDRRAYASTGLWALVVAYGVACAALFVLAGPLERALFDGALRPGILRPALVSVFVAILFYAARSQLRWELRPVTYAVAGVIAGVSTIAASTYLVLVLRTGVIGVFAASAAGNGVALLWCLRGLSRTYALTFDRGKLVTMLRFSAPLTISTLALLAANSGDRVVIRASMGFDDLGVYAAGAKIASAIALVTAGFQLGAAPLVYRHHGRSDTPHALAQLLRLFLAIALTGVLALAAVSLELVRMIAAPAYADAWRVVAVLALGTVLASGYIFLPGLTLRNMTARFAAISIAAAAAALFLMALLAGPFGTTGAALGALGGAATGFALHAAYSQRQYALPMDWPRVALGILLVVGTIGVTSLLGQLGAGSLLARIVVAVAGAVTVVALVLSSADRALVAQVLAARFGQSRVSP